MPKLTIARHASGRMIDIRAADNGLACDCICSCCGERLVARQGGERDWSFAHESGADCAGAIESALHRAAKQVLEEEKKLFVGRYDPLGNLGYEFHHVLRKTIRMYRQDLEDIELKEDVYWHFADRELVDALQSARNISKKTHLAFSKVITEERAEGSTRKPDATAVTNQGNQVYIEFVVTNECDEQKISELKTLGVPTIQIDLSPLAQSEFSLEDVRDAVVNGKVGFKREWLVKPAYIQVADTLAIQYEVAARARFRELRDEAAARHRMEVELNSKPEWNNSDNLASRVINTLHFMQATIHVSQNDTEAIIWIDSPGLAGSAIKEVMAALNAGYTKAGNWVIAGANVFEVASEAFKNKEAKIRRKSAEESARLLYREPKAAAHNKMPESRQEAGAYVDVEAATKAIIAKHSGIVDYQWRRMKINEELVSFGYPQI